ncbi:uncharacterized protein LOC126893824 [Daktulosphaira vitifoliae]|uniref:uncharacterized protein LOC126893824 n=1 Tax=Daktulosphaira vitifoliae TaxID=58002 RepID=UPI0021AAE45B|nr:uncharacterized protein LOC126893824 [Daktulosphaira vitifoliae]XP_050520300.1 uncharacterized protein LOC126893824 [Daktulosphaira vitifoliae]
MNQSTTKKSISLEKQLNYPILFDKIIEIHKCGNFSSTLLDSITLWDSTIDNQFKKINSFECTICSLYTKEFNVWKVHIMSVSHVSKCQNFEDLYSHPCPNAKCRKLIYGDMNNIKKHIFETHNNCSSINYVSMLMSENIKNNFPIEDKPLHYCSHCKKYDYNSIHSSNNLPSSIKRVLQYYCNYCKIKFICCPEALDIHSVSVEHMQLKCYYYATKRTKNESNSDIELIENNEYLKCNIQNALCSDLEYNKWLNELKLPKIVLKRFNFETQSLAYCNLCKQPVTMETKKIMSHINICEYKFDLSGFNKTPIKQFICEICTFNTNNFNNFKSHAVTLQHLTNCCTAEDLYSHFCFTCNSFIYGKKLHIEVHFQTEHEQNLSLAFPELTEYMSKLFKNRNECNNEMTDYCDLKPECVPLYCHACKMSFFSSEIIYNLHEITVEHIILKYMTPKNLMIENQSIVLKNNELDITNNTLNESIELISDTDELLRENQSISNSDSLDCEKKEKIDPEKKSLFSYCSLCCTYYKNQIENHNHSAEHRVLLEFIESLRPSKDTLIYQIFFSNIFDHKSTISDGEKMIDLNSIKNLLINICNGSKKCIGIIDYIEKLRLKSISEENNCSTHNTINDLTSNMHDIELDDSTQQNELSDKHNKVTNASTNTDRFNMEYYENLEYNLNVKKRKLEHSQAILEDKRIATVCEPLIKSTYTQCYKTSRVSDQDFMYGQYVTERLKYIQPISLKKEIKLEIDRVFFSKMTQSFNET